MSMDSDLVAAFLAKGGSITRVPEGARTMTSRDMRAAVGFEADSVRRYHVQMQDEGGELFCVMMSAASARAAHDKARHAYPESQVLTVGG